MTGAKKEGTRMGGEKAGRDSRSVMTYFRECAIVSSPSASSSQALLPSAGKKEGERNRTSRMAAQEERGGGGETRRVSLH